ncbi:hypothetical protein Bbelb_065960 [Branchiostoma belcheri]|nr:hypothetical protein Bbelb_065960 [Branchiostoma belcheri]
MKLAVFGATGPSGVELVKQALAEGHGVTALVRDPDKMAELVPNKDLKIEKIDLSSADTVGPHLQDKDAVLSCLGSRSWPGAVTLYTDSMEVIVTSMRKNNIKRLVCMASWYTTGWPAEGVRHSHGCARCTYVVCTTRLTVSGCVHQIRCVARALHVRSTWYGARVFCVVIEQVNWEVRRFRTEAVLTTHGYPTFAHVFARRQHAEAHDPESPAPFIVRWFIKPVFLGRVLTNMAQMEQFLQGCDDINFTVVRPPHLTMGPVTDMEFRTEEGPHVREKDGMRGMCRAVVARFMLSTVTSNSEDWMRKCVAVIAVPKA